MSLGKSGHVIYLLITAYVWWGVCQDVQELSSQLRVTHQIIGILNFCVKRVICISKNVCFSYCLYDMSNTLVY